MKIGLDTNVLIAAIVSEDKNNKAVLRFLANDEQRYYTTLVSISELLRLLSHPKVFPKPLTLRKAMTVCKELCEAYSIEVLPTPVDWWISCLSAVPERSRENDIFDFQIAWIFQSHAVKKIATYDKGFQHYPFVSILAP